MDIQQKLDSIQVNREKKLDQTPSEHNANKVNELYKEVIYAKKINEDAPENLKEAEINYYKARFGDRYKDVQRQRYSAESKEVMKNMVDAHQAQLKQFNEKIETYVSSRSYLKNLGEVKQTWFDKIKKWIKQIKDSRASINNRNTFYAEQEQANLSSWILFENCIFVAFIIVTLITQYNEPENKIARFVIMGCILIILLFTNTLLNLLRDLPKSMTFYTQWGYDPMESKVPWILICVLILIIAAFFVYVDKLSQFLIHMKSTITSLRSTPQPVPSAPPAPRPIPSAPPAPRPSPSAPPAPRPIPSAPPAPRPSPSAPPFSPRPSPSAPPFSPRPSPSAPPAPRQLHKDIGVELMPLKSRT
jgi:hypothetical protein